MKISSISQVYKTYEAKPTVASKKVNSSDKKDKVNVSDQAREFQFALKAAMASPSVREEKVDAIKSQIDNNSYNVSAEEIANKMMSYFR